MNKTLLNASCAILAFILCLCIATAAGAVSQEPGEFINSYSEFIKQQPVRIKYPMEPDDPVFAPDTRIVYIHSPHTQYDVQVVYVVSDTELCRWTYDLSSSGALNILRIESVFSSSAPRCIFMVYSGSKIENTYLWDTSQGKEAFLKFLDKVTTFLRK